MNEKKDDHDSDLMIVIFDEMISRAKKITDSSK